MSHVRLKTGSRRLAIPAASVRQVMRATDITPVPLTWADIVGVMNWEARAVPVYRLGDPATQESRRQHPKGQAQTEEIVIIEQEGALAGILVERAERIDGASLQQEELTLLDVEEIFGRHDVRKGES